MSGLLNSVIPMVLSCPQWERGAATINLEPTLYPKDLASTDTINQLLRIVLITKDSRCTQQKRLEYEALIRTNSFLSEIGRTHIIPHLLLQGSLVKNSYVVYYHHRFSSYKQLQQCILLIYSDKRQVTNDLIWAMQNQWNMSNKSEGRTTSIT